MAGVAPPWWETAAAAFEAPPAPKWATPGDLAKALDDRTVQTPALDLIDEALVWAYTTPGARVVISMPPQEGKLVADDTPVPTPTGWTKHGDLHPGDWVIHPSGQPTQVVEVHRPAAATMRVHFSDHSHVDVHPAHEWTVHDRGTGATKTVETRYLRAVNLSHGTPGRRGHKYRFHLPHREAFDLPTTTLTVDPYTLGVWLGDGSTSKAAITHHPDDTYVLPYPESAQCVHPTTGIVTTYYRGGMRTALRELGVLHAKHIPAAYLRASERQRRDLLAGLIDTDGHVSSSGQVVFDNANADLVRSVAELLRTLGYRAHVHRPTRPKLSTSGIQGVQEMWRVTYTPHDQGPARLPRKAPVRLGRRERIAITNVEEIDPRPGRCITVSAADGLYLVGEHMTPTHNSQRASRRFPLWALLQNPELRVAIASYELGIARRWGRAIRDDITTHPSLGLRIRDDLAAQHEWQLAGHDGGVYSVGIGGPLTGRPVDLLIIDDPVKDREQADSPTYRENAWDWWTETAERRLSPEASAILIMTRWHPDDLAGRLLASETGERWRVVSIPAQAEAADDPLGRDIGQYMVSARGRTRQQWEQIKVGAPTRTWASLYQQRPAPAEGAVWKTPWIDLNRARTGDVWQQLTRIVVAVDPAAKSKRTSDLTGIVVSALDQRGHGWVLDDRTLRGTPQEWAMAAWDALLDWHATELVVEDNQGGEMVQEVMRTAWVAVAQRRRISQLAPKVTTVTANQSKRVRAEAVAAYYETGRVHHAADGTDRLKALETQMTTWTGDGDSPDRIDALVHGLTALFLPHHSGDAMRPQPVRRYTSRSR